MILSLQIIVNYSVYIYIYIYINQQIHTLYYEYHHILIRIRIIIDYEDLIKNVFYFLFQYLF